MRYCVTGAAGFIGGAIAEALLRLGHEVVGVDCFTDYYPRSVKDRRARSLVSSRRFTLVEADLRTADLARVLDGVEVVLHQAGQPGVRASWGADFADYVTHNVTATQRLLEAVRVTPVRRFVYASSSSIYGNVAAFPTSEDVTPRPFSPYGVSKLAAEQLCTVYAENWGVPTVSLRYFTVYGPGQRPDMAFHRFISAALRGRPVTVFGTGHQRRDFTFVDDVVQANLRAASVPVPAGSVINIAGGSYASVNDVLGLVSELLGRRIEVDRVASQAGDVRETEADTRLARLVLDWQPATGLREGLEKEIDWLAGQAGSDPRRQSPIAVSAGAA